MGGGTFRRMAKGGDRTIGGYRVGGKIRTGRHVTVFEAEDRLGRRIELSCYNSAALRDRTSREAFLDEARRTASLHHENLSLLVDAGEDGEVWYAVSVAPEGPSLREILDRGGALAEERLERLARSVADALFYLDRAGLRHGDLRPETVFLSSGQTLLSCRRLIPLALAERDPRYVSPEEHRIEGSDLRSDLFVLGAILYEGLTGRPAFAAESPAEAAAKMGAGPPPFPPGCSPALGGLVAALLAPRPEDRPADSATMERILSGEIVVAVPGGVPPPAAPASGPAPPAAAWASAPVVPPPGAAPAPAFAPPPAAPLAPPAPARPAVRRAIGRLAVPTGDAIAFCELLEANAFLGLDGDGRARVGVEDPGTAVARIDREVSGDVLCAIPDREPRPRVNGSLVDRHPLAPGDRIALGATEIVYDEFVPERPAPPAPPPKRAPIGIALASAGLCLVVLVYTLFRVGAAREDGQDVLDAAEKAEQAAAAAAARPRPGPPPDAELAAERAFRAAAEAARERPGAWEANRRAFEEVNRLHGATVYGYLASREIEKIEERREQEGGARFGEVVRQAAALLEAGRLYDASLLYRNFAADNPGTLFADQAEREAGSLVSAIEERFAEDLGRAADAEASRDFGLALDILEAAAEYASPELKDKALARRDEVRRRIEETQVPGEPPPGAAPPPGPPVPPPPGPEPGPAPPPPAPEPPVSPEEKQAADLFARAEVEMQRQRFDEVLKILEKLLAPPLVTTRFALDHAEQMEKMRALARLERDGPAALFKGKVEVSRERDVTLTYTFTTAPEEEDWTFIKPFADPELGSFEHVENTVKGKGVGAFVHSAVFEATTLRVSARVHALTPHDIGMMFFEPETMMRFFLFTVQNRYFTIGMERQPLEENVVWIFGGGAWADTTSGNIGFVRTATSKNPTVTAGEWLTLESFYDRDKVGMTLKGQTLSGSAQGDDRYQYPALRPALYVLRSEAAFTEVVIRGTLEDGWLRGVLKRARDRLTR